MYFIMLAYLYVILVLPCHIKT